MVTEHGVGLEDRTGTLAPLLLGDGGGGLLERRHVGVGGESEHDAVLRLLPLEGVGLEELGEARDCYGGLDLD